MRTSRHLLFYKLPPVTQRLRVTFWNRWKYSCVLMWLQYWCLLSVRVDEHICGIFGVCPGLWRWSLLGSIRVRADWILVLGAGARTVALGSALQSQGSSLVRFPQLEPWRWTALSFVLLVTSWSEGSQVLDSMARAQVVRHSNARMPTVQALDSSNVFGFHSDLCGQEGFRGGQERWSFLNWCKASKRKRRFFPLSVLFCYHEGYLPYYRFLLIPVLVFFQCVSVGDDWPALKVDFSFKVGDKLGGGGRVSSRASFHLGDLWLLCGNSQGPYQDKWPTCHPRAARPVSGCSGADPGWALPCPMLKRSCPDSPWGLPPCFFCIVTWVYCTR